MHRILVFYIAIFLQPVFSHAQSCYQNRLTSAIKSYENGKYTDAILQLNVAKKNCTDADKKVLDEWLKKCDARIEEQGKVIEGSGTTKVSNQSIVDSLKKIIARKYVWGAGEGSEKTQLRYIKACNALGDYYLKIKNIRAALFYYFKVTDLTAGTDSDLGENINAYREWEKTKIKVAKILIDNPGIENDKERVLALIYENDDITINQLEQISEYLYKKNAFLLEKPSRYLSLSDSSKLIYLINPLYISIQQMSNLISLMDLDRVAEKMRQNPELTLTCYVQPHQFTMRNQQFCYKTPDAVVYELVDKEGVSQDRIRVKQCQESNTKYNGVPVWKVGLELGYSGNEPDIVLPKPNLRKSD